MNGERENHMAATARRVFVGRKTERATLGAALERAISGRGAVILVAGEPGIGKSELADRLAEDATAAGAAVLWGRAWEGEGAPSYWPWAQIIRGYLQAENLSALDALSEGDAQYVAQVVPEIRERFGQLPILTAIDSDQARFRLFDAITRLFRRAAEARTLVLILDDLHWADKPSLLLLRFLAREIGDSRLLVVAAYRDVEVTRGHPLADVLPSLRQERSVERMLLRGLRDEDVEAMLVALHGARLPGSLGRAISRETEGNPFFIQEIIRHLSDEGVFAHAATKAGGRSRIDEVRLPESIRDVIGRRLGRLDERCAKVLTAASVIGREFALEALEPIVGLERDELFEVLEEAIGARVVEEAPQAIGRYRFAHALIRETLYEGLRTLERIRRHQRVAAVLEELYARDPEPHLTELAHHYLEALPGGDVDKAVAYARRAGDRANQQLAYEDAATFYERALQAEELKELPDEKLRCELLMGLGEARWSVGGSPFENLRQAVELADRLGEPELLARATLTMTGPAVGQQVAGITDLLERALAALGDRASPLRAQVMARLAASGVLMGDPRGGTALARAAIEMVRKFDDKRALINVLESTPWAAWGPDERIEGLAAAEEMVRLAEEIGDQRLAAQTHVWKACQLLELGDVAATDREMEIQQRFAESSRHAHHRYIAALNGGARAFLEGRFEEADRYLTAAGEIARELHGLEATTVQRGVIAFLREQQGRSDELLPELTLLADRYPLVAVWRTAAAAHRLQVNRMEEARKDLEMLAACDFTDIPRNIMWFNVMSRLGDVVVGLGDTRRAALLYDLLLPYADRYSVTGSLPCGRGAISRSLGELATLLERYDEAERFLRKALEMNARIRARVWVTHTEHAYARMLVARDGPGDREQAAELSAKALASAREIGMTPLVAKLVALRAAAGFVEVTPPSEVAPTAVASAVFRQDGDFWTIGYEGKSLRLKDAKGLAYIAQLMRNEGRELHAVELAAGEPPAGRAHVGDAGDVLDAQARSEYRERLEELRRELDEAERWDDSGRAEKRRSEIEFLAAELSTAVGIGGRNRKAADVANRARKAVTSRIRETIEKIAKQHAPLARHLDNSIRTGVFCSYRPDRSPEWSF